MSWKVEEVMTTDVVHVLADTPFKECVDMVGLHRIGALPVVDGSGRLLGILSESDLLRKEEVKGGNAEPRGSARTAGEAMTRTVVTVAPGTAVAQAARLMHRSSVRHLPVTDGGGRLIGIVARGDLLKVFLRSDESIRREIDEELLPRTFGIARGALEIEVRQGVVHISGEIEQRGQARLVLEFVQRVEGVVAVESGLNHRKDDTGERQVQAVR
ncbi:MAG TPA: CBS domain-containing protein [Candidatus Dormibacteraeota bacterium]|jgi:CBS domain-containing protein